MQVLRISNVRRARLLADGLLAINARSQEVLHGLTFEESQFMIDFGEEGTSDAKALERSGELALRHEKPDCESRPPTTKAARTRLIDCEQPPGSEPVSRAMSGCESPGTCRRRRQALP